VARVSALGALQGLAAELEQHDAARALAGLERKRAEQLEHEALAEPARRHEEL